MMKRQGKISSPKERIDQMPSKIKGHNFRITPQRIAVLTILAGSEEHPIVEEIY
jgi:Fur family transcriptional regulator, peroxide stress response regulator